jgi:AAA15 family ATPase/GTPase
LKIKKLHIKNFKSIADLDIIEPNPFTVFVGPNGSGKSNIFEALEFFRTNIHFDRLTKSKDENSFQFASNIISQIEHWFGGKDSFLNKNIASKKVSFEYSFEDDMIALEIDYDSLPTFFKSNVGNSSNYNQLLYHFSRIFVTHGKLRVPFSDLLKVNENASNIDDVLERIFRKDFIREDISEWLELFIPEFEEIIIDKNLKGENELLVKEKSNDGYFGKRLLSDGTYNIIALLTAVFQSDEPQFLCIEEPENGLTPYVIREMVTLIRNACEEKGHYIWLNTHSQSLVSELTPDEVITVNKIKGETKIKQFKGKDFHGLRMDEAWLTNTLGGGLPW